ncbi:MAG TPA: nickel-dependent lactate racemase [Bryobacteraceae bacterium]|jgi:nickel-dependent lactate racemase|nr:nickel-dependent lactate racemase [Bryobacteraceae bacterium]
MELKVAFGKDGLTLDLPEGYAYRVLEAKSAAPLENVTKSLQDALDAPIDSAPLRDLARGKKTAAISVCDITRPAPNAITLPPLLERLRGAGIAPDGVTILIATGLHRPATEEEILRIVGPEIASRYAIVNHHAKQLSEHRFLGTTRRGTPVYIDERFMAADLHLTLGFIEQHLMLGFSGGRKLIAPGLAAQETIKVLHSPKFMREPKAIEGSVAENPLHQELLEIARMARHDFILDTALTRTREIAGVFAGDPVCAHARGVQFVSEALLERLPEPADAVLTTAAGYPLDLTFYQAIKGVTAAQHIVKPGGRILLVAECAEGAGAPEFAQKLREFDNYGELLRQLAQAPVVVDQWQIEKLALAGEKYRIFFYVPGLPGELRKGLGGRAYNRPEEAIAAFLDGLPNRAEVAVIPEGPYVYARVEEPVLA